MGLHTGVNKKQIYAPKMAGRNWLVRKFREEIGKFGKKWRKNAIKTQNFGVSGVKP